MNRCLTLLVHLTLCAHVTYGARKVLSLQEVLAAEQAEAADFDAEQDAETSSDDEFAVEESEDTTAGYKICTFVENPESEVVFGIQAKFQVKSCALCSANKILADTIPLQFMRGRPNKDSTACGCYSVIRLEPFTDQFLFGFTPKEAKQDTLKCDGRSCWKQYQELQTYTKMREMAETKGYRLRPKDYITSANHYSTHKETGHAFSEDCQELDAPVYELSMPPRSSMEQILTYIGDTRGAAILAGMASAEDPSELEKEEVDELKEQSDAKVMVTSTDAEHAGLDPDDSRWDEAVNMLIDVVPLKKRVASPVMTRRMVQAVMLEPKQGICSRNANKYREYSDSECGPIETEEQCKQVARTKGKVGSKFTAKTRGMEKTAHTDKVYGGQPSGCFMRTSGTVGDTKQKWHAFWNELGKNELAATSKSGRSSFEYRILCGCYKSVQEIQETWVEEIVQANELTRASEDKDEESVDIKEDQGHRQEDHGTSGTTPGTFNCVAVQEHFQPEQRGTSVAVIHIPTGLEVVQGPKGKHSAWMLDADDPIVVGSGIVNFNFVGDDGSRKTYRIIMRPGSDGQPALDFWSGSGSKAFCPPDSATVRVETPVKSPTRPVSVGSEERATARVVAQRPECEVKCSTGKACGDSCISKLKNCHRSPGKACDVTPEEMQQLAVLAREAVSTGNIQAGMDTAGPETIRPCGGIASVTERAGCICHLDTDGGLRVKELELQCNELSKEAMLWASPYTCVVTSTKKGGRKSKQRIKKCEAVIQLSWGGNFGGGNQSWSHGGSRHERGVKMDFGQFFVA